MSTQNWEKRSRKKGSARAENPENSEVEDKCHSRICNKRQRNSAERMEEAWLV